MRLKTLILLLFSVLPSIPALSFVYYRPWTPKDPCPTSIPASIIGDPCQFGGRGVCNPDGFAFTTLDSVHSALLNCPNISSLDLSISGYDNEWPDRPNLPLSPLGGEKYPNLKTLKVANYEWDRWGGRDNWTGPKCFAPGRLECFRDTLAWFYKAHWKSWLEWRMQPEEQRKKTNAELWLDAMDWTVIEELSVATVPDSARKVLSRSRALRKLSTADVDLILDLPKNTLTHLSLINGQYNTTLFDDILDQHGDSLESLEVRWGDEQLPVSQPGDLDDELRTIAFRTRNLKHLSVNVLRSGNIWPLETLELIAAIPTLREADLWVETNSVREWPFGLDMTNFEVRYEGRNILREAVLNDTNALRVFKDMRELKKGEELKRMTVRAGDWSTEWDDDSRRVMVECEAKADVDMEDWCDV